jgi:plastocyanin
MRSRSLKRFGLAALAGLLLGVVVGAIPTAAQYGNYPTTTTAPSGSKSPAPSGSPAKKGKGKKGKKKHKKTSASVKITGKSSGSYRFSPQKVTISSGGTVNWSWQSNAPHNVTFQSLGKHSPTSSSGSFQVKFTKSGTYSYLCTVHNFTGTVVVK